MLSENKSTAFNQYFMHAENHIVLLLETKHNKRRVGAAQSIECMSMQLKCRYTYVLLCMCPPCLAICLMFIADQRCSNSNSASILSQCIAMERQALMCLHCACLVCLMFVTDQRCSNSNSASVLSKCIAMELNIMHRCACTVRTTRGEGERRWRLGWKTRTMSCP